MVMLKVKDLIAKLNELDPNLEIFGYTEDQNLAAVDRPYHVFSIENVDVTTIESERDSQHRPVFNFCEAGKSGSRAVAFVNISTDF